MLVRRWRQMLRMLHCLVYSYDSVAQTYTATDPGIGATTVGTGGDWFPQLLGWGTNNVLVPHQFLGSNFQKARNFTASNHQNAGFIIWGFKNLPGWYPRTIRGEGGDPLPHPTPSPAFNIGQARGASAPVLGPKPWSPVPSTFQPWVRP